MAYPLPVQHCQPSTHLVHIQLYDDDGNILVVVDEALNYFVNGFRDVLQHKVKVGVIFFYGSEAVFQGDNIRVGYGAHDLELAVLEPSVLKDLFNCNLRYGRRSCIIIVLQ
jgi:hypothetical protein